MKDFPKQWEKVQIKEIASMNPKIPDRECISNQMEVQFLPMKLVEEVINKIHLTETRKYEDVLKGSYTPFINGDVIFAKVTPCMENGKIAIVSNLKNGIGFGSSEFHVLRTNDKVMSKFLFYYFVQNRFRHEAAKEMTGAVGLRRVPKQFIENYSILLPPLPEQQAIVAKIEELLSDLENGKQQLQTAQRQLNVYRQSLLKWAFEGKELLPFDEFVESAQNGLSKRTGTNGEEYKVLRLADITNNIIDNSSPRKIIMDGNEIDKYKIKKDDLICVRVNGSKDLVGKLVHVSTQNEKDNWAFCDHFIRFRLNPKKAFSKYFHFYFSTVKVRKYIHDNMVTSAGQNTVSQGTIKNVPVPNCSLKEQHLIVQELESKLTICDKIEETISQSLQQAETLRQSILKKAFEGKLVNAKPEMSKKKKVTT